MSPRAATRPYPLDGLIRKQIGRSFGKRATVSPQTVHILDCLLRDFQDRVVTKASKCAARKGRATVAQKDILLAVRDCAPTGIRKVLEKQMEPLE